MSDVDNNLNDALNVYEGEVLSTNSELSTDLLIG